MSAEKQVRKELVNFIETNGYFYLSPNVSIDGAKEYFNFYKSATFFFEIDSEAENNQQKEKLVDLLTLLKFEEPTIQFLTSGPCPVPPGRGAFKDKKFTSIIELLSNYKYQKPDVLTLEDFNFYLNQIDLSSSNKVQIVGSIYNKLESMKPADLLSTWDSFNFSSNIAIFEFYEQTPESKKLKNLNEEFFNVVTKLTSLTQFVDKNSCYEVICYPPLRIIKNRLFLVPINELKAIYDSLGIDEIQYTSGN